MNDLVTLNLCGNGHSGSGVKSWAPNQLKHLQKLNLMSCSLAGEDVEHLARMIPNLVNFNISCNQKLSKSVASWVPQLKQLKHLQILKLAACSLAVKDVEPIAESLSMIPNLVKLQLIENTNLGNFAASWAPHLQKLKHLRKLQLSMCSLTNKDLTPIAQSLGMIPNLLALDLSCNENLGDSAASWAPGLQQLKHLQELELGCCDLTGEDVKHIAVIPTLVELDLSLNDKLRNSAKSWVSDLKQLKHLKVLDLNECDLTDEDVKHLTTSLNSSQITKLWI